MADQPEGKIAGQRDRSRLRVHILFAVFTGPVTRQRAGRVEEYIIVPVISRGAQPGGKMVVLRKREIKLQKSRVSQHCSGISTSLLSKLGGRCEDQSLIARLIIPR